jgi:hypothetical protein
MSALRILARQLQRVTSRAVTAAVVQPRVVAGARSLSSNFYNVDNYKEPSAFVTGMVTSIHDN